MHYKQNYYLQVAAQVAMQSLMTHKHGAVIVHKKKIIASACNYYYLQHSIHAEVAAIMQMKGKYKGILSECELYVVRISKPFKSLCEGILKYSKPCKHCQDYICKKSLKRVFYSGASESSFHYIQSLNDSCIVQ
jgi:deoxycytidylate deaminase